MTQQPSTRCPRNRGNSHVALLAPARLACRNSHVALLAPSRLAWRNSHMTLLAPGRLAWRNNHMTLLAPCRLAWRNNHMTLLASCWLAWRNSHMTLLASCRLAWRNSHVTLLASCRLAWRNSHMTLLAPDRLEWRNTWEMETAETDTGEQLQSCGYSSVTKSFWTPVTQTEQLVYWCSYILATCFGCSRCYQDSYALSQMLNNAQRQPSCYEQETVCRSNTSQVP